LISSKLDDFHFTLKIFISGQIEPTFFDDIPFTSLWCINLFLPDHLFNTAMQNAVVNRSLGPSSQMLTSFQVQFANNTGGLWIGRRGEHLGIVGYCHLDCLVKLDGHFSVGEVLVVVSNVGGEVLVVPVDYVKLATATI
jgi:hypothetical protein